MTRKTTYVGAAVVPLVLAAAATALWLAPRGGAFDEVNDRPAPLGLVGMVAGQTLHISIAYIKGFDPQPDPPGCVLRAGFVDADGNTIGDPGIFELRPGASRSFDHVAIGDPSIRQYVRAVVSDDSRRSECPAVVTGELVNREGISGIIVYDSQPVVPSAFGASKG
jgi:hypothetical protein